MTGFPSSLFLTVTTFLIVVIYLVMKRAHIIYIYNSIYTDELLVVELAICDDRLSVDPLLELYASHINCCSRTKERTHHIYIYI